MIPEEQLQKHLQEEFSETSPIKEIKQLGSGEHGEAAKITLENNTTYILKTWKEQGRNLQFPEDRLRESHRIQRTSKLIPNHVPIHAILDAQARVLKAEKSYVLMQEVTQQPYSEVLRKTCKEDTLNEKQKGSVQAIATYLATTHKQADPKYYEEYLKDWYATGILELINESIPKNKRLWYKKKFLAYENKLSSKSHRCRIIHGEFFSENIFFKNNEVHTYDMRRIGYGEPADDVGSMANDFYMTSILEHGRITPETFQTVKLFLNTYLNQTKDEELLEIIPAFMAYRALIIANPNIVPLEEKQRQRVRSFLRFLLKQKKLTERNVRYWNKKQQLLMP